MTPETVANMIMTLLIAAISLSAVFLYGCVGETIMEKAGHLNLGIPGIMCMGTAGGCFGAVIFTNACGGQPIWILLILISIVFSIIFAAATGAIYAFLTVTLNCNQNITGLAVTTFGVGLSQFLMDNKIYTEKLFENYRDLFDAASKSISSHLPFAENLGWFGELFLSYGFFVYLAIAIAIAAAIVLRKTRIGLNLRAVGENPATADAAGINVSKYKYAAILTGSGVAGLGGFFYIMDYIGGSWENASTVEAFGWMAIALVIFTLWRPALSIAGLIIFAAFYILAFRLPGYVEGLTFTDTAVLKLLPYVITIIVLIITSIFGSKNVQPPAALGLPYFREDR